MRRAILAALAALAISTASAGGDVEKVSFSAFDVYLDCGGEHLAAYQFEVTYDPAKIKIVGIEGGAPEAFKKAPYYDSKGMTGGRMIIAAFSTDEKTAPAGRFRAARLHLQVTGEAPPELIARLVTAARPGGERIEAEIKIERPEGDEGKREREE